MPAFGSTKIHLMLVRIPWRECVMRPCAILTSTVLFGLGSTASGIVLNDDFSPAESRELASDFDTHPAFGAVGQVNIEEGGSRFLGTGTLVARDWVLTSAHNWNADEVTDLSFDLNGTTYNALQGGWRQHPHWEADPGVGIAQPWDFGLFQLETPVAGVAPATLGGGENVLGREFFMLGYGLTGTGSAGAQPGTFGSLHAARNVFDRVVRYHDGGAFYFSDFDGGGDETNVLGDPGIFDETGRFMGDVSGATLFGNSSDASPLPYEGTTAGGDSGAPAFIDFGQGLQLVGLSSWGVNPSGTNGLYSSQYGDLAAFASVTEASDWVYAVIPEPGQAALLAGGVIFVAGMFSRKFLRRDGSKNDKND